MSSIDTKIRVRAIIFDWAGVFCSPGEPFSHPELAKQTGLTVDEMGIKTLDIQNKYYRGQIRSQEFWDQVIEFLKLPSLAHTNLNNAYLSSYKVYPEMLELAARLKNKYRTMLLSNLTAEMMGDIMDKYRVGSYFHETIFSNEVGLMKPDPAIFKMASERLKIPAGETIFIDDSKTNVEAAKKIGLHTILFRDPRQCLSELKQFGIETE